ncbi:MAG: sensor histidine kinase [bacterium]|nr:sensor histidine kinase [bacterium]
MIIRLLPYFKIDSKGNILEVNEPFKELSKSLEIKNLRDIFLEWEEFIFLLEKNSKIEGTIFRFFPDQQELYIKIFASAIDKEIFECIAIDVTECYKEKKDTFPALLIEAQEEERRRISRELHDEIGQSLTAIKMNLEFLKRQKNINDLFLEESISLVDKTINQIRDLSLELRPSMLDDIGLTSALKWYINRQGERAGIDIGFVYNFSENRINKDLSVTIFRVIQEALTNIVRHSRAKNAYVEIKESNNFLNILISDNGIGFDPDEIEKVLYRKKSLGILGMKERVFLMNGEIKIESKPNLGTTIKIRFPL